MCEFDHGSKGKISNDDVITNALLYYHGKHVTSGLRFYKEFVQSSLVHDWASKPVETPSAIACYPKDIPCMPKSIATYKFKNLVHYVDMPHGGHFSAWEEPEMFAADFRASVPALLKRRSEIAAEAAKAAKQAADAAKAAKASNSKQ